jgi:hypothetical protein
MRLLCVMLMMSCCSFQSCEQLDELLFREFQELSLAHDERVAPCDCLSSAPDRFQLVLVPVVKGFDFLSVLLLDLVHIFIRPMTSVVSTVVRILMILKL